MKVGSKLLYKELRVKFDYSHGWPTFHELLPFVQNSVRHTRFPDFSSLYFVYIFLNECPFDYTAVAGSGKVGPVHQVNHTSLVADVTPTGRPKSVRNRCVIDFFCGVVCVVTLPFWHFCWCMVFCHRTESNLFLFIYALADLDENW